MFWGNEKFAFVVIATYVHVQTWLVFEGSCYGYAYA